MVRVLVDGEEFAKYFYLSTSLGPYHSFSEFPYMVDFQEGSFLVVSCEAEAQLCIVEVYNAMLERVSQEF